VSVFSCLRSPADGLQTFALERTNVLLGAVRVLLSFACLILLYEK